MNGIYLHLLLAEIHKMLIGMRIDEVLIQERVVQFAGARKALFVSLFPDARALYVSRKTKRHYKKLQIFSTALASRSIRHVTQDSFKPVVRLTTERPSAGPADTCEITISLYREAPNIRVRTGSMQRDLFPRFVEKKPKKSIREVDEATLKAFIDSTSRLVREIEGLDKNLAGELNEDTITRLCEIIAGKKVQPKLVSAVPVHISLFARDSEKEFASFNGLYEYAVKVFLQTKIHGDAILRKRNRIRALQRKRMRIQKKLLSQKEIEAYRITGELLLSNVGAVKKGASTVRLLNPYDGSMVAITLDPHMSAQENAQNYFRKYKKYKRGQPVVQKKLALLEQEIKTLQESEPAKESSSETKKILEKEKTGPFRVFELPGGSFVYVGKSARSNDELTFKFARPHDYFFHTRGFEGAHTILRARVPRGQRPSRHDIRAAAAIAAYYSKARRQHNVVVSYTQRKYLKKSRKSAPGSVILMREETLFVDPELPE
jgi:predicted ribosome quality control (RQC) complex YloA/Tae2 family protein